MKSQPARHGMLLFLVYCALYGGFMALVAFAPPKLLSQPVLGGVNLAILYGMGLIVAAIALALVYVVLCARDEADAIKRREPEDRP
jgi:uncharacterized membrane protein (DUF485 family)